uniref:Uncharacterized protein n=1 Tax=Tetranychus urticae TaxID=32264 RepID=T1KRG0_TETUR
MLLPYRDRVICPYTVIPLIRKMQQDLKESLLVNS